MSKETRVPAIPNSSDPAVKALKEALEVRLGRRGNELDRAITVRELYENGVINLKGKPSATVGSNQAMTPTTIVGDTSAPPKPTNVVANGAFVGTLVSWDKPARTDLSAEIWRNNSDDRTTAVLTGTASGNIYSDLVGHGQTYYYWVRFVSEAGVTGPFNDIDGIEGETSEKISDIIEDLSDAIGQTHLSSALSSEIDTIQTNSDSISTHNTAITTLTSQVQARALNNLLDMTVWKPQSVNGNLTGDNGGVWNLCGTAAENSIVLHDDGPSGHSCVAWKATSVSYGGADGGWATGDITIDPAKTYRSVVWIKKVDTADGRTYLGCKGGSSYKLDGSVEANPYFWSGDLPELNKWYLIVGIIHGSSYAGGYSGVAGVYDPATGEKMLDCTEFKMAPTATKQTHRSYLYYTSIASVVQYFAYPRFEEVNGNEPSLGALLSNSDYVSTVSTTKQVVDGISAEQFVKVDVNGNVAGYGIYGSSSYNEFAVNANVFKIANGSASIQPFVVIGGVGLTIAANGTEHGNTDQAWKDANHADGIWFAPGTYMDTAYISDASIDVAKIGNLTVDFLEATGGITSNNVDTISLDAQQITSGQITSNFIDINSHIDFSNNASGIRFGKSSLADGTQGAYYGRGQDAAGNSIAGFAISSANSSFSIDSSGTFRMVNAKIYTGTPNTPQWFENPSNNGTTAHIYNLPTGLTDLDIVVVGGGGGGQSNAASNQPYQNSGAAGGYSRVRCYSSGGALLKTIYAAGGAGATYSTQTNLNSGDGPAGEASTHGAGGAGGPEPTYETMASIPQNGYRGSGGGSGGAYGTNGSYDAVANNSGAAGETKTATSVPAGTASLVLEVGAGGAGGFAPDTYIQSGGDGGNGLITITNPTGGGNEIDLEQMELDIENLKEGAPSWSYQAGGTGSGGNQVTQSFGSGAGWYVIKVNGAVANVNGQRFITGLLANDNSGGGGTKQYSGISRYYFTGTPTVSGINTPTNNSYRYEFLPFYWYKVS